ncbi:MAG: deoxyribonuclease IV [Elusimicrobia bacterium]|nr:deoxyribonuclease IV [Elusimicrobiota bacterium]
MRIGVHCSIRKGLCGALEEARRLGCDALQMFTRSPRMWARRTLSDEEVEVFRAERQRRKLFPLAVHTPYLPNLCTSDERLYSRSLLALKEDLRDAARLGAEFLVIHPGAYSPEATAMEGRRRMIQAINQAFSEAPDGVMLLLENVAGGGRRMGATFEELTQLIEDIRPLSRVGVCFDTAHALAAGYAIHTEEGLTQTMDACQRILGWDWLRMLHLNDSKVPVGAHRDLHQHIGKGFIGRDGFVRLLHHPAFQRCFGILETPKDSPQADPRNIRVIRTLLRHPPS